MSLVVQRYSRPHSHYTQVSNTFMRASIPASAHKVACFILSHESGWSLTIKRIADAIGMSRNTVGKAIRDLIDLGYAVRIPKPRNKQGQLTAEALYVSDIGFTDEELANLTARPQATTVHKNRAHPRTNSEHAHAQKLGTIRRPLLEDQEEEGGSPRSGTSPARAEIPTTAEPLPDPTTAAEPSRYCPRHPDGTTAPCRPCGDARRAHDHAQATATAERAAERRAAADFARRTKFAAIDACHRCDDQGFIPGAGPVLCTHGQSTRTRPSLRELFNRERKKVVHR